MSRRWHWKSGDWYIICDVCAKQIYASEARKRWDGLLVCTADYEARHPQDLIRHREEHLGVPFSRSEPTDSFVTVDYIDTGEGAGPFKTYYVEVSYVTSEYFETGVV